MKTRSWLIGRTRVNLGYIDRYYREQVLGLTVEQLAQLTDTPEELIRRNESGHFAQRAHTALYIVTQGRYTAWSRQSIDDLTAIDIVQHARQYELGDRLDAMPADALSMTPEQFDEFAATAVALMGPAVA